MYLRQVTTGQCFAFSPHLEARGDMMPWTGPLPWEKEEKKAAIVVPVKEDTKEVVEDAPTFKCTKCEYAAKTRLGLSAHMRTHKK